MEEETRFVPGWRDELAHRLKALEEIYEERDFATWPAELPPEALRLIGALEAENQSEAKRIVQQWWSDLNEIMIGR